VLSPPHMWGPLLFGRNAGISSPPLGNSFFGPNGAPPGGCEPLFLKGFSPPRFFLRARRIWAYVVQIFFFCRPQLPRLFLLGLDFFFGPPVFFRAPQRWLPPPNLLGGAYSPFLPPCVPGNFC